MKKLIVVLLLALVSFGAGAQFKSEAFTQSYNDDKAAPADSVDKIFSLKLYLTGLTHKGPADVTTMFEGSTILIGGLQIYNKDYWKLPFVYGGIAAGVAGGIIADKKGRSDISPWCYAGAGAVYWATLMDGVVNYKPNDYPAPGKAVLYSLLLPGLGQIYNHEIWKLSIYWGGMAASANYYFQYKRSFERYKTMYTRLTDGSGYTCPVSAETAKYYKDLFRRYRDYAELAFFAVYLLQAIDANVFAYMHNFEVVEDVAMSITPAVITPPANAFASAGPSAFGMSLGFRF